MLVLLLSVLVDWVGDYRGALVWKQCTAAGEKAATITLEAVDGAMRIDLTPAGAALKTMSLVQEDTAWSAQDGDLRVRVSTKKKDTIDLAIDYDSGCTMRAKLVRATTGVAACDRLVAWSRIENRCTKSETKIEDWVALAKAKWKKTDAAKCTARADKLELAMMDKGCAPHPDGDIGTRAVECRSLVDVASKLARCGRVPPEISKRFSNGANALSGASQTASKAELPYVEQQCKDMRAEVSSIAVRFQCQL